MSYLIRVFLFPATLFLVLTKAAVAYFPPPPSRPLPKKNKFPAAVIINSFVSLLKGTSFNFVLYIKKCDQSQWQNRLAY